MAKTIGAYSQICQGLYSKLLVATADTVKLVQLVSEAFARNADLFREMAALHSEIESAELTDLFNMLKKANLSLSESFVKQANLLQEKYIAFFPYYREELNCLKEVFSTFSIKQAYDLQDKLTTEYLKREDKLFVKKQKLFAEGSIQKWELTEEDKKKNDPVALKTDKNLIMQLMLPAVKIIQPSNRNRKKSKYCACRQDITQISLLVKLEG